jgi:hypothetical protein
LFLGCITLAPPRREWFSELVGKPIDKRVNAFHLARAELVAPGTDGQKLCIVTGLTERRPVLHL